MRSLSTTISIFAVVSALGGIAAAQTSSNQGQRGSITSVPTGDPAMEAAFEEARATLDGFLAKLAEPPPNTRNYAVKIRLTQGAHNEYVWVSGLERRGNRVSGRIANEPRTVKTVRVGQFVDVGRSEIYDWMYHDDVKQRMFGNFTLCALLQYKDPEEAAKLMQSTGLQCESDRPVNR